MISTVSNYLNIVPEMKTVSKSAKDLIGKILQPEDKRVSATDIFNDPWIAKEGNTGPLKLNFSKLTTFSKFTKVTLSVI